MQNGNFTLDTTTLTQINDGQLPDGVYQLNLKAEDKFGNVSSEAKLDFTLDTTAPQTPGFMLDSLFDSAPIGDSQTTFTNVKLIGQTETNATVTLQQTGTSITADAAGKFTFTDVPLILGDNSLTVNAKDAAGNTSTFTTIIKRVDQDNSDVVLDWNATLLNAVYEDKTAPPIASRNMAIAQTAVFDAINSITKTYKNYHFTGTVPTIVSAEAAAASAAYTVLVNLYPNQKTFFDTALTASLAKITDGEAETTGVTFGQTVANDILTLRSTDGSNTTVNYTPGTNPGDWQPTPPANASALLPQWGQVTPFALTSGSQFRPAGEPALTSDQYTADFNQVKDLGSINSTTRTADQTQIAQFWADGAGTFTPPGHWNQIAQNVAANKGNSLLDNARLFALLDISLADAGIAAWDTKYTENSWRPITAIQKADTDGNPNTTADTNWKPLITTPPFPSYISGHSTFSGAAATVLTTILGDNVGFNVNSLGTPGVDRTFTNFNAAANEAGISRIYGGIHFNADNVDGLATGKSVGNYVLQNLLAPITEPVQKLSVMPGEQLKLESQDIFGKNANFALESKESLPTGMLDSDGTLIFKPTPAQIGTYDFTLVARDGEQVTTKKFNLAVVADTLTTTRISGVIQNTDQKALSGVVVKIGDVSATTAADGSFTLTLAGVPSADAALIIQPGQQVNNVVYPSIAEKLPLLLGHDVYANVKNVIDRPIFLPPIDISNAQTINPAITQTVTSAAIPGSSVKVAANTLFDQDNKPYTGKLSITTVPTELTPAALPDNLRPDLVVTIQPGEMNFRTPAPLSLPNIAGYAAGTQMDLWSINPQTGNFDSVGVGQVSADGKVINTISGGIRNSSWHFFAPPAPTPNDPNADPRNPEEGCNDNKVTGPSNSDVELYSGAEIETHDLVPYQSLGVSRGLTLRYDSQRADARPIVHFGYSNVPSDPNLRLMAELTIKRGDFTLAVPGFAGGKYGLNGGENFWSIPSGGGKIDAALQADLRTLSSGRYDYDLTTGLLRFNNNQFNGSTSASTGKLLVVNSVNSAFGSGWGLAGLQELVTNPDGSVMLIDGDGSELLFEKNADNTYKSPAGHFSTLERLGDGTFRHTTTDQTVYSFDAQNKLVKVSDRLNNETRYLYQNGVLSKIVDPVGLETTFTYVGNRITAITDPAGRVTKLTYDSNGNLLKITDPDGTGQAWEYDASHHMTAGIDQSGNRGQTFYNFAGRVTNSILKDGSTVKFDPVEVQGLYEPNKTNDPLKAPVAFQLGAATSTYTDSNGNKIVNTLDRAGQIVSSADDVGLLPSVKRNQDNLVTQQTDARGNKTKFTYDQSGNVLSMSIAAGDGFADVILDYFAAGDAAIQEPFGRPVGGSGVTSVNPEIILGQPPNGLLVSSNREVDWLAIPKDSYVTVGFTNESIVDGVGDDILIRTLDPSDAALEVANVFVSADGINFEFLGSVTEGEVSSERTLDLAKIGFTKPVVAVRVVSLGSAGSSPGFDLIGVEGVPSSIVYPTRRYTYDPKFNQLTSKTDELGHQTLYQIDPKNGNLLSLTQVVGAVGGDDDLVTKFTYTDKGLVDLITDPLGRITDEDYDAKGRLTAITYAKGTADEAKKQFEYDAAGNQTAIIDENGNRTAFEYDALNRLVKTIEADPDGAGPLPSPVTTYGYDARGNLISTTDAVGNVAQNAYDQLNRLIQSIDALNQKTTYGYDKLGNLLSVVDPLGHKTENKYDARNRVVETIDPSGSSTRFSYDSDNNLATVLEVSTTKNNRNNALISTNDGQIGIINTLTGEFTKLASTSQNWTDIALSSDNKLFGITSTGLYQIDSNSGNVSLIGNLGKSNLNALGIAPNNELYATGGSNFYKIDSKTGTASLIANLGSNFSSSGDIVFDPVRSLFWATSNLGGTDTLFSITLSGTATRLGNTGFRGVYGLFLDEAGNLLGFTSDGKQIAINKDTGVGTLQKTVSNLGSSIGGSAQNITGNLTTFAYDARNSLISETDPLGKTSQYQYDAVNNLIAKTDRNNRQIEYKYDDINRRITETWVGNNEVINYSYDKASNQTAVNDKFSSLAFTYDNRDSLLSVNNAGTPGFANVLLNYNYDKVGNVLSVADTINNVAGGNNSYSYDALNRLTKLTQSGNDISDKRVDFGYNALGQYTLINRYANLTGTQLVNGTNYTYDSLNRLTNLNHSNGTNNVAFYNYVYDVVSRITKITDVDGATDYAYDNRDQLTGANHSNANNPDETYTYDANGNRITSSIHGNGYVTGQGNRLLSDGKYNYEYDNERNLTKQTEIATGKVQELTWDYRNRLVAFVDKDAAGKETQRVEFTYDAFNRRIAKAVDTNPQDTTPGVVTQFIYDGQNVLLEFVDSDGAGANQPVLDTRYLHGAGIDQVMAQESAGNVEWHLTDHLGTVRDLVNNSGAVVNHFVYDSFGQVISESNPAIDTRYLFTGREFDQEIGLYYYRARYYNQTTGKFLSEDTLSFTAGDSNLYRYVFNNPVAFSDPTGEYLPLLALGLVGTGAVVGYIGGGWRGAASGAAGTAAALVTGLVTKNPYAAGAAAGSTSSLVNSALSGKFSYTQLGIDTGLGTLLGPLAGKVPGLKTRGRLPDPWKNRRFNEFVGINSKKLLGQEALGGTLGNILNNNSGGNGSSSNGGNGGNGNGGGFNSCNSPNPPRPPGFGNDYGDPNPSVPFPVYV